MKRKVLLVTIICLLLSFNTSLLLAEGQGEGEVSEAPKNLTIYASIDEEACNRLVTAFEEETGIDVSFVRLSSGEAEARIEAERENPQASIWLGGVGLNHISAKNKGLTMVYDSPAAVNIPDNFKDKDKYWTGIYTNPLCFGCFKPRMEELGLTVPASWQEICDPKYEGLVQMANPGSSGTSYNVVATLVQQFGEDEAFNLLQKLDHNIDMYTRSGSAPLKSAARGEGTIAIGYTGIALRMIEEGFPLELIYPSEGTGFEIASISMIKNGPQGELEAAKIFYDFILGETAAKILADGKVVPLISVPLPEGMISIDQVKTIVQDDEWAASNKARLIEKWNDVVGGEAKTEPEK